MKWRESHVPNLHRHLHCTNDRQAIEEKIEKQTRQLVADLNHKTTLNVDSDVCNIDVDGHHSDVDIQYCHV